MLEARRSAFGPREVPVTRKRSRRVRRRCRARARRCGSAPPRATSRVASNGTAGLPRRGPACRRPPPARRARLGAEPRPDVGRGVDLADARQRAAPWRAAGRAPPRRSRPRRRARRSAACAPAGRPGRGSRLATAVISGLETSSAALAGDVDRAGEIRPGPSATRPSTRSWPPLRVASGEAFEHDGVAAPGHAALDAGQPDAVERVGEAAAARASRSPAPAAPPACRPRPVDRRRARRRAGRRR